jgi:TonB family protein
MSATSTPLLDFYRWGFPNAPIQIHLCLDVVNGIRRQIQDCWKAPDALSQCGLLIGISQPGITRILHFEPLETLDTASLEAAMLGLPGEVVGFYRTTAAGSSPMPVEDRALTAKFPKPSSVFLLIETIGSSIGNARFCFWGEDELVDWPMVAFPFVAEALASRATHPPPGPVRKPSQSSRTGIASVPPVPDQKVAAIAELAPRPAATQTELQPVEASVPRPVPPPGDRQKSPMAANQPQQRTGRPWLLWVILAAVLVLSLSLGAFSYFRPGSRLPVAPQPAAAASTVVKRPSLGLAVEKRGNGLLVSWDGNAPIISKANFGMLLIRGSGVSRDVPLTTDELRAGGFVYTLAADELRFQFNVVAGEQVAREFLTVLRSQIPEGLARLPVNLTGSRNGNSNGAALPPLLGKPVSAPQPVPTIRQFEPAAPSQSAAAPPLRLEEPPAAGVATPVNTTISLPNQPPASAPAPIEVQGKEVLVKETPQSDSPQSALPAEAHPPVATHRVIPVVPIQLRGHLWDATVVEVRISVDASGSVVKAEAVPKPGLHPALRDEAVKAASWWKFQPARFNGHPVPAEIVVQFNFAASR